MLLLLIYSVKHPVAAILGLCCAAAGLKLVRERCAGAYQAGGSRGIKKDPGQLSPRPLCSVGCRGWLTNPDHKHQSTNVAFIVSGGSVTVSLKSPLITPTSASFEATRSSWSSFSRYPAIPIPSSR